MEGFKAQASEKRPPRQRVRSSRQTALLSPRGNRGPGAGGVRIQNIESQGTGTPAGAAQPRVAVPWSFDIQEKDFVAIGGNRRVDAHSGMAWADFTGRVAYRESIYALAGNCRASWPSAAQFDPKSPCRNMATAGDRQVPKGAAARVAALRPNVGQRAFFA